MSYAFFVHYFLLKFLNDIKLFFIIHLQLEKYDVQAKKIFIIFSGIRKQKTFPTTYNFTFP